MISGRPHTLVARLDSSSTDDPGHSELLGRTFAVLDHDVRSEEDELLPRLQQVLSARQLRMLGVQWELVRRISPTRPHPVVSRRPPGQTLSALPLTLLDRSRDRLQQLDELTHHRLTRTLSTLDRVLAAAAGWGSADSCEKKVCNVFVSCRRRMYRPAASLSSPT